MAELLSNTQKVISDRNWDRYVVFEMMVSYLEAAGFLEEFHDFVLESAQLENELILKG